GGRGGKSDGIKVGGVGRGKGYRHPALLAKMAATVDQVSNGRLILGMGAGWFEAEFTAYGIPFYTASERAKRLVEAVRVVTALSSGGRASYAGKFYQLAAAPFDPPFVQRPHPPFLIAALRPKRI